MGWDGMEWRGWDEMGDDMGWDRVWDMGLDGMG